MDRPNKFPEFALIDEIDSINGQPNVKEPSEDIKNSGWNRKQDIYKQYLNWIHRTNNDWVVWLNSLIDPIINEDFTTIINQAVRTNDSPTFINLNLISHNSEPNIIFKRSIETLKDDVIASLKVMGNNETESRAIIDFNSSENWSSSANGTYIRFLTTQNCTLTTSEIMRIAETGNVGIGTTNPTQRLDIRGNAVVSGHIALGKSTLEAWNVEKIALEIGGNTTIMGHYVESGIEKTYILTNTYHDGTWKPCISGSSSIYMQGDDGFKWQYKAGLTNDISFLPDTIMSLSNIGVLNISSLIGSRVVVTDASKNLVSSIVTDVEVSRLTGVKDNIQDQIDYVIDYGFDGTLLEGTVPWSRLSNIPDSVITLDGDCTGSCTMTNLASATLTVAILDDSHIHDGRYYTETEADSRFVNVTGDSMTGNLNTSGNIGIGTNISAYPLLKNDAGTLRIRNKDDNDDASLIVKNLTVNGTTTTINSQTVLISDNVITLNSDVIGIPYQSGGIEVERGDQPNASLIWDEGSDVWKAGIAGGEVKLADINYQGVWGVSGNNIYYNMGNVGIGTTVPSYPLHIIGDAGFSGTLQTGTVPWARLSGVPSPVITLGGDCTGSVTLTSLGSATLTVTVTDDSHIHDGRYYTEAEADSRFVNVTGDSIAGNLNVSGNVGIGTAIPSYPLHVIGNFGFSGTLQIGTVPWVRLSGVPSPVITLGGDCTGSVTLTSLGSATLTVTVTDDSHNHSDTTITGLAWSKLSGVPSPVITVGGDCLGSATLTSLGSATLTVAVTDDSHSHSDTTITGLAWSKLSGVPSPVITLGGDCSGSTTLTSLGSATLTVAVTDDSHSHSDTTITGLAWSKLSGVPSPVITLGGDCTGSVTLTSLGSATLNVTVSNSDAVDGLSSWMLWNNMGNAYTAFTDFNSLNVSGAYFVGGTTNGPGIDSQSYLFSVGLGIDYEATYRMHLTIPRNSATPYPCVRFLENGTWGSWSKIYAGYSDSAGNAETLDSLHSGSFLRADAANYYTNLFQFANTAGQTLTGSGELCSLSVHQPTAGKDAGMTFHVGGDYACYFGLDGSTNDLFVGGWSMGAIKYRIWHSGNMGVGSGLNADTLDGYHGSNYIGIDGQPNGYYQVNNWVQINGNTGIYAPNVTGVPHLYPIPSDYSYGSWMITGSKGDWAGIAFGNTSGKLTFMANSYNLCGIHNQVAGAWQWCYDGSNILIQGSYPVWHTGNLVGIQNNHKHNYLWSTTHPNDYYIYNEWTGSKWRIKSNHSDTCSVSYADNAGGAGNSDTTDGYHTGNYTNWSSLVGCIDITVGTLAWKNYGNNHVVFDASNSTAPNGSARNNTNSEIAWSANFPTLMGWNGNNTYGVRVDCCRYADSAGSATYTSGTLTVNGTSFNGGSNIVISTTDLSYCSYQALTISSNTIIINLASCNTFKVVLNGNVTTVSIVNILSNKVNFFTLYIEQDGAGGKVFTPPTNWLFSDSDYSPSTAANAKDLIQGMTFDNGANWIITYAKGFS